MYPHPALLQPYGIELHGFKGLPERDRLLAEQRFMSALEFLADGPDGVLDGYAAFCVQAIDGSAVHATELAQWCLKVQTARTKALRGLPVQPGAYFEIVPGHHTARAQ